MVLQMVALDFLRFDFESFDALEAVSSCADDVLEAESGSSLSVRASLRYTMLEVPSPNRLLVVAI